MEKIRGKVWKFGENVNTDEIIPARYLNTSDPLELAGHCMEDADPGFSKKHAKGDIIVAGKNFGCGSSREHAPIAIKASGIAAVVADSFARIFFRNAVNIGLPIVEIAGIDKRIKEGDTVQIDFDRGVLSDLASGEEIKMEPYPPFMQEIIRAGGLMNRIKKNA